MKSIENISPKLEKVILKGLELSNESTHIKLFKVLISLYRVEDTVFIYYQHQNTFSNKSTVNVYEIKSTESYYLFETINMIVKNLENYGTDTGKQDALKIYSAAVDFCKKIDFEYRDFEEEMLAKI